MGWISVEEKLPELNERVLVLCRFGLTKGRYADFCEVGERIQYPEGPGWKGYGAMSKLISHWMPLPEAPKEE